MALGRGTIIIAKIDIRKITMVKSFDFRRGSKKGAILTNIPF